MNPAGALLAQASATLDAADRLGHSNVPTILAAIVLVLAGAVVVLARELVRQHAARLADAAARNDATAKHAAETLALSEKHAAEMLALQGTMIPRIAEVTDAATALSGVAEALTDARDTFDRATPLSTPTPAPRGARGGRS